LHGIASATTNPPVDAGECRGERRGGNDEGWG